MIRYNPTGCDRILADTQECFCNSCNITLCKERSSEIQRVALWARYASSSMFVDDDDSDDERLRFRPTPGQAVVALVKVLQSDMCS